MNILDGILKTYLQGGPKVAPFSLSLYLYQILTDLLKILGGNL